MALSPGTRRLIAGASMALWPVLAACEAAGRRRAPAVAVNSPVAAGPDTIGTDEIRSYLAGALGFTSRGGRVFCSYAVLGQEDDRIYLDTACEEFVVIGDSLVSGSGRGGPVALTLDSLSQPLRIVGHRVPGDGNRYGQDIRQIFPDDVQRQILASSRTHNRRVGVLQRSNREAAVAYFADQGRAPGAPEEEPCDAPSPDAEAGASVVRVFFACGDAASVPGQLYPAFRAVPAGAEPVEAALRALVAGPTRDERAIGLRSHFSTRTADALLDLSRSSRGDTVTIDFAADLPARLPRTPDVRSFLPPGVPAEITWTLFDQFPEIEALRLRLDGDESAFWRWLGGEPQVFTRREWEEI